MTVAADVAVHDGSRVNDTDIVADGAPCRVLALDFNVLSYDAADGFGESLVLLILHHEGCQLRVQSVEYHDVPLADFVENRNNRSLAVGCPRRCFDGADIADVATFPYLIVVDVVPDVLDEAVVSDAHVLEHGIPDAAMLAEVVSHFDFFPVGAELYGAVEFNVPDVVGRERLGYMYRVPVLCGAALSLQLCYLACG